MFRSRSRGANPEAYYASQLDRLTAAFAYCSDMALTMGGKIKVGRVARSLLDGLVIQGLVSLLLLLIVGVARMTRGGRRRHAL